ncbi:MAG: hypothetical protein COA79_10090 [Planctomycetota bacterium]|nr:MAG: hypothetical protein COA79_10090 [Planctomycetota bacterium]
MAFILLTKGEKVIIQKLKDERRIQMKRLKYFLCMGLFSLLAAGCGSSGIAVSSLEELNLNTGEDPTQSSTSNSGPSKKMLSGDSNQLLDNLKAQHFKSNVRIVELPAADKFTDVDEMFAEKTIGKIDYPFADIVSLQEVVSGSTVSSGSTVDSASTASGIPTTDPVILIDNGGLGKKLKNNTISFELSGSFDYLWPTSYDDNTLKFSSIYYVAGNFFDGVGRDQTPALFLRFKEGFEISKVLADDKELVFHLYDDKRTVGILGNTKVKKVEIQITNSSDGSEETVILELKTEKLYYAYGIEDGVFNDNVSASIPAVEFDTAADVTNSSTTAAEGASVTGVAAESTTTSQTNIQVAGVDEADIAKTDGTHIFAIKENSLVVYDVSGSETSTVTTYNLEVFPNKDQNTEGPVDTLAGAADIALVAGDTFYYNAQWQIYLDSDSTVIVHGKVGGYSNIVILSFDGAALTLKKSFLFNDSTISTRKIGNKLLLLTQNYLYPKKGIEVLYHFAFTESQQSELQKKNDEVLASLTVEDFGVNLNVSIMGSDGVENTEVYLNESDIFYNENSGGHTLIKIIQIEVDGENKISTSGTLVDGAENIYVTKDSLYIWNTSWSSSTNWWVTDWASSEKTNIYRFEIKDEGISFHSHAQTDGHIINRFAVSEHESHFRVATYSWVNRASAVKVLEIKTDSMAEVGSVGDIAPGERLQSTRFVGAKAYLVTFLRTDPLFTLDLSDPTTPTIKGELKITGFSEYLHPIDEGTLLGLGRDATTSGFVKGVQLSSFDVSDMTNPTEIDKVIFGESGYSIATSSPHAFTWYPTLRLVAFPLKIYDTDFSGLAVYKLTVENKLEEVAILKDNSLALGYGDIRRAVFIGSKLYYLNNGDIVSEVSVE